MAEEQWWTEGPWWTVEATLSLESRTVRAECAAAGATEEEAAAEATAHWLSMYRDCDWVIVTDCYPLVEDTEEEEL